MSWRRLYIDEVWHDSVQIPEGQGPHKGQRIRVRRGRFTETLVVSNVTAERIDLLTDLYHLDFATRFEAAQTL